MTDARGAILGRLRGAIAARRSAGPAAARPDSYIRPQRAQGDRAELVARFHEMALFAGASVTTIDNDVAAALDVELVDFEALLKLSDYVSIHVPMMPETENLFDADAFAQMKPDALLVNTARGPLVDTEALAKALDAGEIGGAALDVMPVAPPVVDERVDQARKRPSCGPPNGDFPHKK